MREADAFAVLITPPQLIERPAVSKVDTTNNKTILVLEAFQAVRWLLYVLDI